jgi:hypothetical protein
MRLAKRFRLELIPLAPRTVELLDAEVAVADFELANVQSLFDEQYECLMRFAHAWYADCNNVDYGEESDASEGDQQEHTNAKRKVLGIGQGFLLGYAMLLLYAKERPNQLVQYIKKRRIPHAKKVAKDVSRIAQQAFADGA